jgi:hypothetical protein
MAEPTVYFTAQQLRDACQRAISCAQAASNCSSDFVVGGTQCYSFISGFEEGYWTGIATALGKSDARYIAGEEIYVAGEKIERYSSYCLPSGVLPLQKAEVFVKYASEHPEQLQRPASEELVRAFLTSFPCKR